MNLDDLQSVPIGFLLARGEDRFNTDNYPLGARRGSQVVRPGTANPLFAGSIPARASIPHLYKCLCFEQVKELRIDSYAFGLSAKSGDNPSLPYYPK